jgi:hypothetical protein
MGETARRTVKRDTTREDGFLAALLAGEGISKACTAAGISRSTGLRLRKSEEFQQRFREARGELLTATVSKLHTHAIDFVDVLHTLATDIEARGSDRVLAARHGLDLLLRGVETLEFSERISKLEQIAGEPKK